ncbi:hypothetical protein GCM10025794_36590 [Massilia kyonggiensis]
MPSSGETTESDPEIRLAKASDFEEAETPKPVPRDEDWPTSANGGGMTKMDSNKARCPKYDLES